MAAGGHLEMTALSLLTLASAGLSCFETYSVSQKIPTEDLWQLFQNCWEFFNLLCVPIYATVQIFIQLSANLTKLCHIKRDHPVHIMCAKCPPSADTHFLTFFPNGLEFLVQILPAYYMFLSTLDYKSLFNYLQL